MFQVDILRFNKMYNLPVADRPTLSQLRVRGSERLEAFMDILREELGEGNTILEKMKAFENNTLYLDVDEAGESHGEPRQMTELEILTDLADWLGDMQVYCASEMAKYGIPIDNTKMTIMSSNFSKLGADGQPIYDERGKVMKGPNYWKPEPALAKMLNGEIQGKARADELLRHQNEMTKFTK